MTHRSLSVPGILTLSALLAGVSGIGMAAVADSQGDMPFDITNYELDNGLRVVLVKDQSAPTVAVSVWYRVGGADDPPERSGFAHLFEHMMFQGSAGVPRGKHSDWISAAGGNHNASTGMDRTNYFEELPAHQLPLALWLEADRMRSLIVDEDNFQREREVVKEEYRQRIENQPYGEAFLTLQTVAYDYEPYRTPVIGSVEDLDRSTVEEVRQFHSLYYAPNNAVLTVAGDIDIEQTEELVLRYFGDIPAQTPPPPLPVYEFEPQQKSQEITIEDRLARVPALFMVYRLPHRGHPDYYATELLSDILGTGDSSRLAQALVDTGLATVASSSVMGNLGPSLFYVVLIPNPGIEVEKLVEIYSGELARLQQEGPEHTELTKAINGILTSQVGGLQDALGLAESVQEANFYLDDPDAVLAELERYREVTPADVKRVANQYLNEASRNIVNVVLAQPDSADGEDLPDPDSQPVEDEALETYAEAGLPAEDEQEAAPAGEDRAEPVQLPDPLPIKEFALPEIIEASLENGLRVITAPQRSLPYLTIQLVIPGGESTVPSDLSGLAELTADLLPRGTETRTAQQIASAIEQVGGDLSASAYDNSMKASVTLLSEHADLGFELLEDMALHPTFPQEELEIQRQRALTGLEATLANPTEIAHRAFNAVVFGAHPYGRNVTEQSLTQMTRYDVLEYYRSQLNPKSAMLVIAGDISPEEALDKARTYFGAWESDLPPYEPQFAAPPERTTRLIYLVDRPGSSQADVVIGHLGLEGESEDRYAAQVANQVLGAGSTSRLFLNLREAKGYTYGVYSGFSMPRGIGKFLIQAAVRNEVVEPAIREMLKEMRILRESTVPSRELEDAKSYLTGSFALRLETVRDLANQIISLKMRELPLSSLRIYPQAIERIDDQAVLDFSKQYIHPESAAIVVVGDAAKIKQDLQKIAPVMMVDTEGDTLE